MITLHYLKQSCSHRIVWLLEELGLDYELKIYEREPETGFAPKELKALHPLGKAPVLQDGHLMLAEGNAIIQHLLDRYDHNGKLAPKHNSDEYSHYLYWLSISASLFSANLMQLLAKQGDLGAYKDYAKAQTELYFQHIEQTLNGKQWIVGEQLTGADFSLSFPLQWGKNYVDLDHYPNIHRYLAQIEQHPSYLKANQKSAELDLSAF